MIAYACSHNKEKSYYDLDLQSHPPLSRGSNKIYALRPLPFYWGSLMQMSGYIGPWGYAAPMAHL